MEKLINEFSLGMFFWQTLLFLVLLFLLKKFAWKPILKAVNDREGNIQEALEMAEKTKAEMKQLQAENENILKEARIERDNMIKEAKETSVKMIEEAKAKSKEEATKIMESANQKIEQEKNAALAELKKEVATIALTIAEKVISEELSNDEKQQSVASKLAEDISLN